MILICQIKSTTISYRVSGNLDKQLNEWLNADSGLFSLLGVPFVFIIILSIVSANTSVAIASGVAVSSFESSWYLAVCFDGLFITKSSCEPHDVAATKSSAYEHGGTE